MYRFFLLFLALLAAPSLGATTQERPNFVVILADDLGVETVGAYGGESYRTPHIDRLAAEGVRFDNAHATPLCTPTRVMLLTGKESWRNYSDFGYLDPAEPTFAQRLAEAGYATFAAGKWQLVSNKYQDLDGATPSAAGFADYALWQVRASEDETDRYDRPTIQTPAGPEPGREGDYGPARFAASIQRFIRNSAGSGRPFLAYYPMVLPHRPFSAPPGTHGADRQQRFADMMVYMDTVVGDIRATLEEAGVADNTLLLFIGDNGTDHKITSRWRGQEVPGGKATSLDSGTHVPFIAWWPGRLPPNHRAELVSLVDVLPTLLELGAPQQALPAEVDGRSLWPLLAGETVSDWRDSLFMHYDPRWSDNVPARYAFDTRWKLYEDGRFYNIADDPLEEQALDAPLSDAAEAARLRLQQRLDAAGGELSGVLSPQSQYRRERDRRRALIAIGVLALWGLWYGRRRYLRATLS
ncbi:sulfatase-like hydrolase/transferase [Parahaliea aestuarii]|uniref:Sulfatase-like hydrolase/transferase n=1 Tax=Parahaliea aestuarii TaxID=1852021 RepID=A0A5C8ZVP6_9GAMM|nr:sulfatase-like hydrolase/transferase [Parahaliea aestuarii]TXS92615.1 sulfatase-like hydrolase/transferase [Parahaliea aestuarii]